MARAQKTSVFGRLLGIGFSNEPLSNGDRIDVGKINAASTSSGVTLPSNGLARINSTAAAATALVPAPTEGAKLEIAIVGGSSLVTLACAAAGFTIGTSSTGLVFTGAAANGLKNQWAQLRGISSTQWAFIGGSSLAALA